MTAREVVECIKRINKRLMSEAIFEAKIHGAIKETEEVPKVVFTEKDDKTSDKAISEALERLKKRKEALDGKRNNDKI